MHQPLTPAATRVLDRAIQLAAATDASSVQPHHLLRGLILEEARASEILSEHGISMPQIDEAFPQEPLLEHPQAKPVPLDDDVTLALQEARHLASSHGRHAEVGTEHLLWGLMTIGCPVSSWLFEQGCDFDEITRLVDEKSGFSAEPLATDVTIQLSQPGASERHSALRIIDAAANRAREGIRTIEDFARFACDDRHVMSLLKDWRHDFAAAMATIPPHELTAARETETDVGTSVTTAAEAKRASLRDVLSANVKRVQEAVRSLEEYGKMVAVDLGGQFEQLRYRFYTIEKALLTTVHSREQLADRTLYLLVTEELCHHGSGPAIREALAGGVDIVQLREKSMDDRALVEFGRRVRQWTRDAGGLFIMNDRPDLAVLTDADGVHVGQEELTVKDARRIVGTDKLVGVSTHTIEQARQAVIDGADYIGVGPVFPSTTKSFDDFAGLEFVRQVAAEIQLPWYAIGGINAQNLPRVIEAGATRVAVSSAVCSDEHPKTAAATLKNALATS